VKRLPRGRASGEGLLARLLELGGLIAVCTALVAGCVNVYVQPAPTATFALLAPGSLPTPRFTLRPTAIPQPGATPVSSFTFTGSGPGFVPAWLGDKPYLVTLTVTGGGCGIVFESIGDAKMREGVPGPLPGLPGGIPGVPGLDVAPKSDWLWVEAELGGHTERSASAVMQYEETDVNDPPGAGWEQSWAFYWPAVAIRIEGDCPTWEIRGERKG